MWIGISHPIGVTFDSKGEAIVCIIKERKHVIVKHSTPHLLSDSGKSNDRVFSNNGVLLRCFGCDHNGVNRLIYLSRKVRLVC